MSRSAGRKIVRLDDLSGDFCKDIFACACAHAQETGYSARMLQYGFEHMLAHWNRAELSDFLCTEIPGLSQKSAELLCDADLPLEARARLMPCNYARDLLLVTASTVPSAAFQDAVLSLILPVRVTLRPAHNLIALFLDLAQVLSRHASLSAARLRIEMPSHDAGNIRDLCIRHDALCVSGSDDTIELYRQIVGALPRNTRHKFIAHGHKISAIAIKCADFNALSPCDYRNLALDASLWDQNGCLSPKCVFIEARLDQTLEFAQNIARGLDDIALDLPEMTPDLAVTARKNNALRMLSLEGASVFHGQRNHDAVVVYPEGAAFQPVFMPRWLNVYPVQNAITASTQLAPFGQALATRSPLNPSEIEIIRSAGFNCLCRFGTMQDPPLSWFHDSVGTIRPLVGAEFQQALRGVSRPAGQDSRGRQGVCGSKPHRPPPESA